ncbi:DUF5615 family PIN-like protein [Desulfobacterales bacterium HSG2]|nr:DUF5615 family PIN-like protein [Desulfobacterales bacterium HSG2]
MSRKVRFYTDEHVSRAVINGLRNRGADVLTTKEAGMLGADDKEIVRKFIARIRLNSKHRVRRGDRNFLP